MSAGWAQGVPWLYWGVLRLALLGACYQDAAHSPCQHCPFLGSYRGHCLWHDCGWSPISTWQPLPSLCPMLLAPSWG